MSKKYDPKAPCWDILCPVDVSRLLHWLWSNVPAWPPVVRNEPNAAPLPDAALPVVEAVCRHLGPDVGWLRKTACLSRLVPGVRYGYHSDGQPTEWITRVHVPLLTSSDCWFAWEEEEGKRVYMHRGWAYAFNTIKAHSYGNDGNTDRVHLLFDAVRTNADNHHPV